jgi:hypothetical protein
VNELVAKDQLFLAATTAEVTGDTIALARGLAVLDWTWTACLLSWLRRAAHLRLTPITLAAEAVDARLKSLPLMACPCGRGDRQHCPQHAGEISNRMLVREMCQRLDDTSDMIAYWVANMGRNIPAPVRRGVADALTALCTQAQILRWDDQPMRIADVISLAHPRSNPATGPVQPLLYEHLITDRHHRAGHSPPLRLTGLRNRYELADLPLAERHRLAGLALAGDPAGVVPIRSAAAGRWDWVMEWLGEGKVTAYQGGLSRREQWELVIPWMPYDAIIESLPSFDDAGIRTSLANKVMDRLTNPIEVEQSRLLPYRFLAARHAAPARWGKALETALDLSLASLPELPGRTLVLVDLSGSMTDLVEGPGNPDTDLTRVEAAALFGAALARRNPRTELWGFADTQMYVKSAAAGASVLAVAELIAEQAPKVGVTSQLTKALLDTYSKQDRVIICTDEPAAGRSVHGLLPGRAARGGPAATYDVTSVLPRDVHVFAVNLAGYGDAAVFNGPYRYQFGGLDDHTFALLPIVEYLSDGIWPWELPDAPTLISDG